MIDTRTPLPPAAMQMSEGTMMLMQFYELMQFLKAFPFEQLKAFAIEAKASAIGNGIRDARLNAGLRRQTEMGIVLEAISKMKLAQEQASAMFVQLDLLYRGLDDPNQGETKQ